MEQEAFEEVLLRRCRLRRHPQGKKGKSWTWSDVERTNLAFDKDGERFIQN